MHLAPDVLKNVHGCHTKYHDPSWRYIHSWLHVVLHVWHSLELHVLQ